MLVSICIDYYLSWGDCWNNGVDHNDSLGTLVVYNNPGFMHIPSSSETPRTTDTRHISVHQRLR